MKRISALRFSGLVALNTVVLFLMSGCGDSDVVIPPSVTCVESFKFYCHTLASDGDTVCPAIDETTVTYHFQPASTNGVVRSTCSIDGNLDGARCNPDSGFTFGMNDSTGSFEIFSFNTPSNCKVTE